MKKRTTKDYKNPDTWEKMGAEYFTLSSVVMLVFGVALLYLTAIITGNKTITSEVGNQVLVFKLVLLTLVVQGIYLYAGSKELLGKLGLVELTDKEKENYTSLFKYMALTYLSSTFIIYVSSKIGKDTPTSIV